jgi:hypothetical protein
VATLAEIKAEIAKPEYAGLTDAQIATALQAVTATRVVERMLTSRGLYAELGPTMAETILQKLEGAAQVEGPMKAVLARAVDWLNAYSGGIDVGNPYTRGMLDTLVTATVLTAEEVAALKAIAEETYNPFAGVYEGDVAAAKLYG